MRVGKANVIDEPLVAREKIVIPPLHRLIVRNRTWFMKQFVKALLVTGDCLNYIWTAFLALTIKKLKAGILDGPRIGKPKEDPRFVQCMTSYKSVIVSLRTVSESVGLSQGWRTTDPRVTS